MTPFYKGSVTDAMATATLMRRAATAGSAAPYRFAVRVLTAGMCCVAAAAATTVTAHGEDSVTYEVFSKDVPVLAGVEYRDAAGKHQLSSVQLPWSATVAVSNVFSAADDGAEIRADWRPPFRTPATVGRVLQGQLVTVRIVYRGQVLCESTLDVGNAACYGSTPHSPQTGSSYDRSPLFPEPASGLLPGEDPRRVD